MGKRIWAIAVALFLSAGAATAQIGPSPGGSGSGSVTSIDTTCGVSGGPITTTGTIQGSATPNPQTGTSYAIQNSDCGKLITFSNTSAIAATIAQAGGSGNFASGWFVTLINENSGVVTVTPTTSTIDGQVSLSIAPLQSIDLYSDGSNYFTARGRATVAPPSYYTANNWYTFRGPSGVTTGNALAANTFYCAFGYVDRQVTIGAVGAHVNTVGSTNVQFGLYAAGADGYPGARLATTTSVANTSQGARTNTLSANVTLGPGTPNGQGVWACTNQGDSTAVYSVITSGDLAFPQFVGATTADGFWNTVASSSVAMGLTCAGANCNGGSSTLGTWPSTLAGSTWSIIRVGVGSQAPLVQFQVVSAP